MNVTIREGAGAIAAGFGKDDVPEGFRQVVIEDENTLRDALRDASASRRRVFVTGGGTHLGGVPAPREPGDVLDMSPCTGIVAHEVADLTVTVRAGETLAELDRALAAHGQYVSLHADHPERATIGGILASGLPERHELRHVTLRDQVLGVTAHLMDGTRSRSGGRLVKNVTGYDLPKLFTGSRGTLGVITEVSLRCRMRASSSLVVCYPSREPNSLSDLARLAHDLRPTTVDRLNEAALQALGIEGDGEAVCVRWDGEVAACSARRSDLERACGSKVQALRTWEGDEARAFGDRLDALRRELSRAFPDAFVLAVHVLPSEVQTVLDTMTGMAETAGNDVRLWSEPCLGSLRMIGAVHDDMPIATWVRELAGSHRHIAFEQAPPAWRSFRHPLPANVPGARWMTRIKRAFDPDGLLWPGAVPEAEIEP